MEHSQNAGEPPARNTIIPVEISVSCGSRDEADAVMRSVVEQRLAACAQTWPITSCYRWEGDVEIDDEHLVVIKSSADRFDEVGTAIGAAHSYDLPAITMVPLLDTGPGYLDWLSAAIGP